jgi:dTDP-4-amino-4,6-dideoxygalactose transaminase
MMAKLAINGGKPVRTKPFPPYVTIGNEEKEAVAKVLDSTVLSNFLGTWSPEFFGGPQVQNLEKEWVDYFGVRFALTMNSATSGLYAAIGAAGVGPGDEVVVSPYTMTASVTCVLAFNAVPVFADIDSQTFCLTPETIKRVLTPRTKAIVVVDLFGQPVDIVGIMVLAKKCNLLVIEDAAQAPGAKYQCRYAGTLADMGVFSLNYHKTIHTGEGGVVVTDRDDLAERLQLIRNHGEVVVEKKGVSNIVNMIGFNFRMTEIEAAIGREQLKKLDRLVAPREEAANYLTRSLKDLKGISPPVVGRGIRHGYYVYAIKYDSAANHVPRDRFAAALRAEGIPIGEGYVRPIYLEPLYQKQIAYGNQGCPFTCPYYQGKVNYARGLCPVTERMHFEELITTTVCHAGIRQEDLDDVATAFRKVLGSIRELT